MTTHADRANVVTLKRIVKRFSADAPLEGCIRNQTVHEGPSDFRGSTHGGNVKSTKSTKALLRLLALLMAFVMIAAACGDDDGDDGSADDGDSAVTDDAGNDMADDDMVDEGMDEDDMAEDDMADDDMADDDMAEDDMADDFSAAFLYISPIGEAGWTWAHDQGRLHAEEATGIPTFFVDSVNDGSPADIEAAIRTLVADGHDVIIGTSFGYMDTMEAMAAEFPDVVFEHVSGYKANETNFGNTFGKIYQPRYLTGMIAGAATETNQIGYVAAFPIPEVARGINAFTLGAQRVNPDVEVVVQWTSTWFDPAIEGDAADALLEGGADVIAMHQDTTSAGLAAEAAGARWVSYNSDMSEFAPDAYLASAIWNWGPRYAEIISSAADGSYVPGFYWGGYEDGIVDIGSIAADVDADIVAQVEDIRQQMIDGTFAVFSGPLFAQDGTQLLAEGEVMDPGMLLGEAFFVQGVVGDIG
ncbi:MAG: BMP family ABC transporter substrate-binding protein [Acidimicrobiaceae bacterium]|nr:BMP family ABC transporter substrate-binding protein [Acidimicrobiaceae bacterium]